jgi:hypothetical protein
VCGLWNVWWLYVFIFRWLDDKESKEDGDGDQSTEDEDEDYFDIAKPGKLSFESYPNA